MRTIFAFILACALAPLPAFAQALPDDFNIVESTFNTKQYNITTHDGQAAFTDAVICALHAKDNRWGNLRKSPGQTNIHGHAEDSALFLRSGNGNSQSVDFIGNAGTSNARPAWTPDQPRYSANDWQAPHNCGAATPQPPVVTPPTAPVVDLSAVLSRLDTLTTQQSILMEANSRLAAAVRDLSDQLKGLANRTEDVLLSSDRIIRQLLSPPDYRGGTFVGTLRPVVKPVSP